MEEERSQPKISLQELIARISAGVTAALLEKFKMELDSFEGQIQNLSQSITTLVLNQLQHLPASELKEDPSKASKAWVAGYVKESIAAGLPDDIATKHWVEFQLQGKSPAEPTKQESVTQTWVSGYVAEQLASRFQSESASPQWVKQYVQDQLTQFAAQNLSGSVNKNWIASSSNHEEFGDLIFTEPLEEKG